MLGDHARPSRLAPGLVVLARSVVVAASGRCQRQASDAVLELLHGRVFLLAPAHGSLGSNDHLALEAFVQMPAKHHVELILRQADNGGHVGALLALAAIEDKAQPRALPPATRAAGPQAEGRVD